MDSVSAAGTFARPSPLDRLQNQLKTSVTNGTVKSADQDVLSTALTSIDQSITQSRASQAPGTRTDPRSQVQGLIDQQVQNGTLTSDQASELQSVFQQAFSHGPGGAGGPQASSQDPNSSANASTTATEGTSAGSGTQKTHGHHHHHRHADQGDQANASATAATSSSSSSTSSTNSNSTDSTTTSDANSTPDQLISSFLDQLKASLTGSGYASSGTAAQKGTVTALLVSFKV